MSFIYVNFGGRAQFQFVRVDDNDNYKFSRMHRRPVPEVAQILLERANELGTPPILFDVGSGECLALCRELQKANYPRIVKHK